jgi:hypothetical protein
VRCLVHYFERVTDSMPTGLVSFERKVLPRRAFSDGVPYPDIHAWVASSAPLCQFTVRDHCILNYLDFGAEAQLDKWFTSWCCYCHQTRNGKMLKYTLVTWKRSLIIKGGNASRGDLSVF